MAFVDELGKNNEVNILNSVSDELEPAEIVMDIPIELKDGISPSFEINKSTKIELVNKMPDQVNTKEPSKINKPTSIMKKKVEFQQPIEKIIPETPIINNTVVPASVSALPAIAIPSIMYISKNFGFSLQTVYLLVFLVLFGVFIFHQGRFPKH